MERVCVEQRSLRALAFRTGIHCLHHSYPTTGKISEFGDFGSPILPNLHQLGYSGSDRNFSSGSTSQHPKAWKQLRSLQVSYITWHATIKICITMKMNRMNGKVRRATLKGK